MRNLFRSIRVETRAVRTSARRASFISLSFVAATLAARCGTSADGASGSSASTARAAQSSGAAPSTSPDARTFCAALLTAVQPLIRQPLTVKEANDATNDDLHKGEAGYLQCQLSIGSGSVTITLSDEKGFTNASEAGYAPLPAFGDLARATTGSLPWVDVMKGKTFCEAIVAMNPAQLTEADWRQAGGKMCNAAYAKR